MEQEEVTITFSHALWEISDLSAGSFILADFLGMQVIWKQLLPNLLLSAPGYGSS